MTHFLDKPPPEEDLRIVIERIFGNSLYKNQKGKQQIHNVIQDHDKDCGEDGCVLKL